MVTSIGSISWNFFLKDGYNSIKKKEPKLFQKYANLNFMAIRISGEFEIDQSEKSSKFLTYDFEPKIMEKSWVMINIQDSTDFENYVFKQFTKHIDQDKLFKPKDFHNLLGPILKNSEGLIREHHFVIRNLLQCSKAINDRGSNFLKEEIRRFPGDLESSISQVLSQNLENKSRREQEKEAEISEMINISSDLEVEASSSRAYYQFASSR